MRELTIPYRPILRSVVGSTVHGLNVQDGIEDRDEMAVCIEDYDAAQGLSAPFEQYIYRTAALREGKHDAKSRGGDLDLVVYSLRKWLRLANRPELVEKYGFDTKYAMHMLRLGYQGVELLETGRISLPMPEPERSWLRGVRTGESELQDVLTRAGELRARLEDLLDTSPLAEQPNHDLVNAWMLRTYWETWRARQNPIAA